jgi:hypothetical protein
LATVGAVTTGVRPDDDLGSVWDAYLGNGSEAGTGGPRVASSATAVYPKRSELRRAERAGARRGGDRRPTGSRPRAGQGPQAGHPGHLTYAAPAERGAFGARGTRPTEPRFRPAAAPRQRSQHPDTNPSGILLPRYGDAFPIDQATPPRGVQLPVTPWSSAVLPADPPVAEPFTAAEPAPFPPGFVPPTVPASETTGAVARVVSTATSGLPVVTTPDPATWTDDDDAAPRRRGRRRGDERATPAPARQKKAPKQTRTGTVLAGRGSAGAARLLVLALVVGFEGLAVTSLARTAASEPEPHDTLGVIPESAAVLAEADTREAAAKAVQQESTTLAVAHETSGADKMAAALHQVKAAADRARAAAERRAAIIRNAQQDPRSVARLMLADHGWGASQFSCLNSLWNKESRWNYRAQNPSSGAYGIPQALPGTKMASAGSDWRTNPVTQIEWGLDYIADRYGTPCAAWGHSQSVGWY